MKRLYALLVGLTACASGDASAPVDAPTGGGADASVRRDAAIVTQQPDAPTQQANTCMSAATCQTAMMLGTVSGDTGAGTLTADGHQSAWFRVRVTEDYSAEIGLALRLKAKLTMPGPNTFDTFVYVNASSDTVECNTTTGTVTNNGNMKEVKAEWGEGFIPNGADDSRDVTIEVRPMGTACSQSQAWHLDLEGNWL
jgi:hypothetical protein